MSDLNEAVATLVVVGLACTFALARGLIMLGRIINKGFDELLSELKRRR